ncbi:MAG: hypothetical protein KKB38_20155 [Gammaproteobacteria bacterium]|nr:hypothetical protein [Gammaproteobacteria bacterium]
MEIKPEAIRQLKSSGMTLQEIGDLLGITKSEIHLIYHSESIESRRDRLNEYASKHYHEHSKEINKRYVEYKKEYARKHVLMVNGKTTVVNKRPRPNDTCELCSRVVDRLHYHHWDDGNPHLGVWVCSSCHKLCESVESGLHTKYLELKDAIIYDN